MKAGDWRTVGVRPQRTCRGARNPHPIDMDSNTFESQAPTKNKSNRNNVKFFHFLPASDRYRGQSQKFWNKMLYSCNVSPPTGHISWAFLAFLKTLRDRLIRDVLLLMRMHSQLTKTFLSHFINMKPSGIQKLLSIVWAFKLNTFKNISQVSQ